MIINQIIITKASGQQAPFSPEKLKRSSLNVGASEDLAESIVDEIGTQKMLIGNDEYLSEDERTKFEKNILKRQKEIQEEKLAENLHNEMKHHLLKIGVSLRYHVTPASNDKSKAFNGQSFSFISISKFPELPTDKDTQNTIKLIDVL